MVADLEEQGNVSLSEMGFDLAVDILFLSAIEGEDGQFSYKTTRIFETYNNHTVFSLDAWNSTFDTYNDEFNGHQVPVLPCLEMENLTGYKPFAKVPEQDRQDKLGSMMCVDMSNVSLAGNKMVG